MAMPWGSKSDFSNWLKIRYRNRIAKMGRSKGDYWAINRLNSFAAKLDDSGDYIQLIGRESGAQGFSMGTPDRYFPTPIAPTYFKSHSTRREAQATIAYTKRIKQLTRDNAGGIVKAQDRIVKDTLDPLFGDLNRQVLSNGTGALAQIESCDAGANTITLTATPTVVGTEIDFEAAAKDARWIKEGMKIVAYARTAPDSSGTQHTFNSTSKVGTVGAVSGLTFSCTWSDDNTPIAANDYIYHDGSIASDVGQVNAELHGVSLIISEDNSPDETTAFQDRNRSTYGSWKAVIDSSTTTLTAAAIETVLMEAELKNGGHTDEIWVSSGVYRRWGRIFRDDLIHTNPLSASMGSGKPVFIFGDRKIPVHVDWDLPPNKVFGIDKRHLFVAEWLPQGFYETNQGIRSFIQQNSSGNYFPAEVMFWQWGFQLMTDKPNSMWGLTAITEL